MLFLHPLIVVASGLIRWLDIKVSEDRAASILKFEDGGIQTPHYTAQ
jgi:hypothetical protein